MSANQTKFLAADKVTIADFCGYSIVHNIFNNESMVGQPQFGQEFNKYPSLLAYSQVIEQEF